MDSKNPKMKALITEHRKLVEAMQVQEMHREDARRRCASLSSPAFQGNTSEVVRRSAAQSLDAERRRYLLHTDNVSTLHQQIALVLSKMRQESERK